MSFRKRYPKRSSNKDKYSVEQTNIITPPPQQWTEVAPANETEQTSYQFAISIIPPTDLEGMRKIKHLTISFSFNADTVLYYALVYVPQGYQPQTLHVPAQGFAVNSYKANQFVMSSGALDFTGGPCRIRSPLSRNLNSGDSVYLLLGTYTGTTQPVLAQVKYAITLQ